MKFSWVGLNLGSRDRWSTRYHCRHRAIYESRISWSI